jgi:outer membrane protein assembly factor BamA
LVQGVVQFNFVWLDCFHDWGGVFLIKRRKHNSKGHGHKLNGSYGCGSCCEV